MRSVERRRCRARGMKSKTARDGFGAVEEPDVGLAGIDAREQIFFRKDLRGVFVVAEQRRSPSRPSHVVTPSIV